MRYVSFLGKAGPGVGVVLGQHVFPDPTGYAVSADGEPLGLWQLIQRGAPAAVPCSVQPHRLDDVRLLAPFPRPSRDIVHVLNRPAPTDDDAYGAADVLSVSRTSTWVLGPEDDIPTQPGGSGLLEFAPKLGIILGREARGLTPNEAADHIWGYTLIKHVLVLNSRPAGHGHTPTVDHLCVMGPFAVPADVLDLTQLTVQASVNDDPLGQALADTTRDDLAGLVASISAFQTLQAGDIITVSLGGTRRPMRQYCRVAT